MGLRHRGPDRENGVEQMELRRPGHPSARERASREFGSLSPGLVRHVYVHAPFCARRCVYCDFAVTVDRSPESAPWTRAIRGELAALAQEGLFRLGDRLETLFVGGGTPSLLGAHAMADLAVVLGGSRLSSPELEWTAEANPESFTPELAGAWRRAGVTRVSLGIQSFHSPTLAWMGRLHGPEGARAAVEVARQTGFPSFNVDLMFGLPRRLGRDLETDLEEVIALDPPHVSLYGLTVERGTALGRAVAEGRERPADEDRYREEYLLACEALRDAGFEHYEVSNFCRPTHASRHNRAYWGGASYLGLGNGAHSYRASFRRWNLRGWSDYQRVATEGRLPVGDEERLDRDQRRLERSWLGLRTRTGLSATGIPAAVARLWQSWIAGGLAERDPERIRLTPAGWLILDTLVVALDSAWSTRERGVPAPEPVGRGD